MVKVRDVKKTRKFVVRMTEWLSEVLKIICRFTLVLKLVISQKIRIKDFHRT